MNNALQSVIANVNAMFEPSAAERGITTEQHITAQQGATTFTDLLVVPSEPVESIDVPAFSSGILFRMRWIASSFTNALFTAATAKADDNQPERINDLKATAKNIGYCLVSMVKAASDLGIVFHDDAFEQMVSSAVGEWCNGGNFSLKDEAIKARAAALGVTEQRAKELMQVQSLNYSNRMASTRPTLEHMLPVVMAQLNNIEPGSLTQVQDWTRNETMADADKALWSIIEAAGTNVLTSWDNAAIFLVRSWFASHGVNLQLPEVKLNEATAAAANRKREYEQRRAEEARIAAMNAISTFQL